MTRIQRLPLPEQALHQRYAREGAYTDCYGTVLARRVTQAEFVEAFYTTWLFKLERWILARAVNKPSTDAEARAIASGETTHFAAWTMEARTEDQLLMCDFLGATRSWFQVVPEGTGTRLHFGSAVVSRGRTYRALLGFHKLYSRALLAAARARLRMPLPR